MAGKDPDGPSLELPSFGFRRRRAEAEEDPPPPPSDPPPPPSDPPAPPASEEAPVPRRGRPRLPRLEPVPAALVTGLLVGLATVGLVVAAQGGCELVRGTSSCGRAGFLLLLAVLVAAGLLGAALLTGFGVTEGGSTSFLAMGLVAVVVLLVLADHLFAWWMALAVPAVAMAAYVASHRVTTAMVEPRGREMHR